MVGVIKGPPLNLLGWRITSIASGSPLPRPIGVSQGTNLPICPGCGQIQSGENQGLSLGLTRGLGFVSGLVLVGIGMIHPPQVLRQLALE